MTLPAIRQIEAFPMTHEGQNLICLRDPEGIVEDQILLTPPAFFIACHLNGMNDMADIQYAFARQFSGQLLVSADVWSLVETLNECGFLDTDRFVSIRRDVEATFARAEIRPAFLAGKSYPDEPAQLRGFLDGLFVGAKGPGERPGERAGRARPAKCLIAPHIDFHRGGHAYAHGYLRLFERGQPATVFVFGVAHASPPVPFILTQKHFDTPFGVLETDRDIVKRLESVCTWDPYDYEIVHRTEHSIELQAVMLSYLYGSKVRIVPILCGSFGLEIAPADAVIPDSVTAFLNLCRDIVMSSPQPISVIAGADLAHVGQRFGDAFDIDDTIVNRVAARDREDLGHVIGGDADGFYRSVMRDRNQRRVCGLNCIYAALKTVEGITDAGDLLHYDYAHDPAGGIVSFTNILFT